MTDYYKILGVARGASKEDIKKAYKKLSMKYHPDRNMNATADIQKQNEEKFKELSDAYNNLTDDNYINKSNSNQNSDPFRNRQSYGGWEYNYSEPKKPKPKANMAYLEKYLNIEDVLNGGKLTITYMRDIICNSCSGLGGAPSDVNICGFCNGTGKASVTGFRGGELEHRCGFCNGLGKTVTKPCGTCGGKGTTKAEKTITIDMPKLDPFYSGGNINVIYKGAGNESYNCETGDLKIQFNIKDNDRYSFRMGTLTLNYECNCLTMIVGGYVDITLYNKDVIRLKIPKGIDNNQSIKITGKGYNGKDLYLKVVATIPKDLSGDHIKMIEEILEKKNL